MSRTLYATTKATAAMRSPFAFRALACMLETVLIGERHVETCLPTDAANRAPSGTSVFFLGQSLG
ncbi:hypothetical protein RT95_10035 [Xanthomonas campestris]|nr:hypothetical protein RT95_10035 [Xanthomonas campestris]